MLRLDICRLSNVGCGVCQFCVGSILVEGDAFALESGEGAVNLFVGMFFCGERVVHLIVEQIALLFAQFNEQPDLVLLFLNFPWQWFLPSSAASLPGPPSPQSFTRQAHLDEDWFASNHLADCSCGYLRCVQW